MRVVITSLGMISPVGIGVVASAGAIRAGVSFPDEIEHLHVLDEDTGEAVPIRGHLIHDYTEGFHLFGRFIRIAAGCVEDVIAYGRLPDRRDVAFWRATGLALVTPVPDLRRFDLDEPWSHSELADRYGGRLLGLTGLPISPQNLDIIPLGHAGVAIAVQRGARAILERRLQRVLVLGADSYLDQLTLEWLSEHRRLKTADALEDNPVGLTPGEAGACFLLESEPGARSRGAALQAVVAGAASGNAPSSIVSDEVDHGASLASVIAQVLPEGAVFTGDLIADLNGEEWRARELASARMRLSDRLTPARLVCPASSLGDTGAASGAAAVCVAVRSFVRGYHSGGQALVTSSSEHGGLGALRLSRA